MLMPVVAFVTKARSSGSAPRKAPSASRAASSAGSRSRAKNATGSRSIRARHSSCAASTARGVAPNEPWLRKVTPGSSVQWTASSDGIGWVSYGRCDTSTPPEAIVFDLDGTLVDTVGARIDAWQAAFAERGIEVARDRLEPMIGMDGRRLAAEVLGDERRRGGGRPARRRAVRRAQPRAAAAARRPRAPRAPRRRRRDLGDRHLLARGAGHRLGRRAGAVTRAADRRRQRGPARQAGARPAPAGGAHSSAWIRRRPGTSATRRGTCVRRWRPGCARIGVLAGAAVGEGELRSAGAETVIGTLDELVLPE